MRTCLGFVVLFGGVNRPGGFEVTSEDRDGFSGDAAQLLLVAFHAGKKKSTGSAKLPLKHCNLMGLYYCSYRT